MDELRRGLISPLSPQPKANLIGDGSNMLEQQHTSQTPQAKQESGNHQSSFIRKLHNTMKKSSIPLSTGRPKEADVRLKDIFKESEFKLTSMKAPESNPATQSAKVRYSERNVKNKQSSIPFAKFKQPNYMKYNQYGTSSNMMSDDNKNSLLKLRKVQEDKNA